jgi:hypothetical protein
MAFLGENGTRVVTRLGIAVCPEATPVGRAQTRLDTEERKGTVVKQLGMLCTVKWDDGETSDINSWWLDTIPPSI